MESPRCDVDDEASLDICDVLVVAVAHLRQRALRKRKAAVFLASEADNPERDRHVKHTPVPRVPMVWSDRLRVLSDNAFKRRYRMPKHTFAVLCADLAEPMAEKHMELGQRLPRGVSIEVQVSAVVRWLAGGSYLDIVDIHGISHSVLYYCIDAFVLTVVEHPKYKIKYPIGDAEALEELSQGFARLDRTECFDGCVGALDGLIIPIRKPCLADCANPANYRNRKGMFAIIAQVFPSLPRCHHAGDLSLLCHVLPSGGLQREP